MLLLVLVLYTSRISFLGKQKKKLKAVIQKKTDELIVKAQEIEQQKEALAMEKHRVEELLLNIFPSDVAEELKSEGKAKPRHFDSATVMFTDIKGFTQIAEMLPPQELVAILDKYFTQFDTIIYKHGVEKIKTIGDSYMCVGGIPVVNKTHPVDVTVAALEIQKHIIDLKREFIARGEEYLDIKIGVHTGELTAGVVGQKRFAYDIWGNTVNVAHRMEETCVIEKINVSGETFQHIEPFFDCTYRGKIPAKNKGLLPMYFVNRLRPKYSADETGLTPNAMFREHVKMHFYSNMRFTAMEREVYSLLEKELPEGLHYHGIHHTRLVCNYVEEIALAEGVRGEELFYLKTAAILHDAGFIHQYTDNEPIGAKMAGEILPKHGYNNNQIEVIQGLIMATKVPQEPTTHLQKILCDADLFYLGGDEFYPISESLMRELLDKKFIQSASDWDPIQLKFLAYHYYHTDYARKVARPEKLKRIKELKKKMKAVEVKS